MEEIQLLEATGLINGQIYYSKHENEIYLHTPADSGVTLTATLTFEQLDGYLKSIDKTVHELTNSDMWDIGTPEY